VEVGRHVAVVGARGLTTGRLGEYTGNGDLLCCLYTGYRDVYIYVLCTVLCAVCTPDIANIERIHREWAVRLQGSGRYNISSLTYKYNVYDIK
jgi:hypothetical protein